MLVIVLLRKWCRKRRCDHLHISVLLPEYVYVCVCCGNAFVCVWCVSLRAWGLCVCSRVRGGVCGLYVCSSVCSGGCVCGGYVCVCEGCVRLCVCAWADIHRERVTQTYLTTWVTGWESAYKWPFQTHGFLDAIWVVPAHITADQTGWLRGSYGKGTEKERTIFPFEQLLSPLGCWRKKRKVPHSPSPPQFPSPSLFHLWALAKEFLHIFLHLFQVLLSVFFFFFFFFFSWLFQSETLNMSSCHHCLLWTVSLPSPPGWALYEQPHSSTIMFWMSFLMMFCPSS